jgi:GT2 family glycosyltransferase
MNEGKVSVDVIYIVVSYKDDALLKDMIASARMATPNSAVIVVNNYFDEASSQRIELLCRDSACLLVNNSNTGYGPGNNVGISKALELYDFRYLVISNPDIIIEKLDPEVLDRYPDSIIGPFIHTPKGKSQNPYQWRDSRFIPFFLRAFARTDIYLFSYLVSIHKAVTSWLMKPVAGRESYDVYAVHGSFIVLSRGVLDKLFPFFNDQIFLFAEEDDIARRAKKAGVRSVYLPTQSVIHHHHGSLQFSNLNLRKIMRESILKAYE